MIRKPIVLAVLAIVLVGTTGAANYMYEKASVKGVGYKNVEQIVSTQEGFAGAKLVEKESGSGNVITERTELEAERQIGVGHDINGDPCWGPCLRDYINFTKEAEFEYMPVSYQTGTYDQKWIEKLCVQNYKIGAVLTEMYTHAEHLQKDTEVKTRYSGWDPSVVTPDKVLFGPGQTFWAPKDKFDPKNPDYKLCSATPKPGLQEYQVTNGVPDCPDCQIASDPVIIPGKSDPAMEADCVGCCTGVLEANLNSNVIGVAHIGWISRDPGLNVKGRHNEWGRSVEDLTGVFSIEKFIQLWGNSTCGQISVDWLPCV